MASPGVPQGCRSHGSRKVQTGVLVHRYYDPSTGQFLSVDPAVTITEQPYAYTGGDPVNGRDPAGLCDLRTGNAESPFQHLYNGPCQGMAATAIGEEAAAATESGITSPSCSLVPWSTSSCFRQGWEQMPGWAQVADATLPITLPALGAAACIAGGCEAAAGSAISAICQSVCSFALRSGLVAGPATAAKGFCDEQARQYPAGSSWSDFYSAAGAAFGLVDFGDNANSAAELLRLLAP
jgi:hypothetical protein